MPLYNPTDVLATLSGDPRTYCAALGTWYVIGASAVAVPLTGSTSETALATISIPAGAMGANGRLRITVLASASLNNANSKTLRARLGGISGTIFGSSSLASVLSWQSQFIIRNRNSASSQVGFPSAANVFSNAGAAPVTASIDTSVAQDLVISGQLGTGTDTLTLEDYMVEILYKA